MAQKANHHIVPQFYLRSFAAGLDRKARITAFDHLTGEHFVTWVRNVAAVRHFNRVKDNDGNDTNVLEDAMAAIESEWAPLFREVVEAGAFPSSKHREAILTLVATLSLRSGRFRESMEDITAQTQTMMMDIMLASKERWERAHLDAEVPYEELKRFWDSRAFELTYDQSYFIGHELNAIEPVYELLARRSWCFVRPGGTNRFITCDDPVALNWKREVDASPLFPP